MTTTNPLRSPALFLAVSLAACFPAAARAAGADSPTSKVSSLLRSAEPPRGLVRSNAAGERQVYLHVDDPAGLDAALLGREGVRIDHVSTRLGVVQAWVAADRLDAIAALPFVRAVTPPVYGEPRAGSEQTEGDEILHADELRALGFDGEGVKIGVISNGVDSRPASVASGDLPEFQVFGRDGIGDEGTAMLEIIHDIAPAATLGFCGGSTPDVTTADFLDCAERLVGDFGADIIVDDLGFKGEPYFEDGALAQAVAAAVGAGVLWVSSAGNDGQKHYQAAFNPSGDSFGLHNFGGGDRSMLVSVPVGGGTVFVQWANPFGGASDSYHVCITNDAANELGACSERVQGQTVPLEALTLPCAGPSECGRNVAVRKISGADVQFELFFSRAAPEQHGSAADSIYGHPAVRGVLAVTAIDADDSGHDEGEPFNSQGPSTILFPENQMREKPELAGIDGVQITGVGGVEVPFFGTSAAAAHVAGIAAQVAQAFPDADSADLDRALSRSAVDIGATGADRVFGAGRVDALAAAQFLDVAPESTIDEPAATTVVAPGGSVSFAGTCADADSANGVRSEWTFGQGSGVPGSNANDPGSVAFPNTGTFEVTLTCVDAIGKPDDTPDTVTVVVGMPPDGTIDSPPADLTVVAGEVVSFASSCTDADSSGGLTHRWSFGDGSGLADLTSEDPGPVTFSNAGTFTVSYTCVDAGGASDPTPATRTITVDSTPDSVIDEPAGDVTATRGSGVTFAGTCVDADGGGGLTMSWSFGQGSGIPDSTAEDPGEVVFGKSGTFTVTFTCKDRRGISDPTPATRTVTVPGKKSSGGGCSVAAEDDPGAPGVAAVGLVLIGLAVRRRRP